MITVITLPSTTLVNVGRIVFWDRNNNGKLDSRDVAFELPAVRKRSANFVNRCVANCSPTHTGMPIYWRHVIARDIRRHGGRRFRKAVAAARRLRARARSIGHVDKGLCYTYGRSLLPMPVAVSFNPALTFSTKLIIKPFRRTAIPQTNIVSPSKCRAVEALVRRDGASAVYR